MTQLRMKKVEERSSCSTHTGPQVDVVRLRVKKAEEVLAQGGVKDRAEAFVCPGCAGKRVKFKFSAYEAFDLVDPATGLLECPVCK